MSQLTNADRPEGSDEFSAVQMLTRAFYACSNWPKEREGVLGLAEELERSSKRCGIAVQSIIDLCKESSPSCPTAFDIQRVAGEMKVRLDEARAANERRNWEKLHGPPQKYDCQAEIDKLMASAKEARTAREQMEKRISEELKKRGHKDLRHVSLHVWLSMQAELGYTLTPEQKEYL